LGHEVLSLSALPDRLGISTRPEHAVSRLSHAPGRLRLCFSPRPGPFSLYRAPDASPRTLVKTAGVSVQSLLAKALFPGECHMALNPTAAAYLAYYAYIDDALETVMASDFVTWLTKIPGGTGNGPWTLCLGAGGKQRHTGVCREGRGRHLWAGFPRHQC
jgi:hypothetical protein